MCNSCRLMSVQPRWSNWTFDEIISPSRTNQLDDDHKLTYILDPQAWRWGKRNHKSWIIKCWPIIEATNQHTISRTTWGLELYRASSVDQIKTKNVNTNVQHEHNRSPRLVAHFRLLRLHWRCNCAAQSAQQRNKADLREADKATYSDWWPQVEVLWNSCIRTWGEQDSQGVQYVGAARS